MSRIRAAELALIYDSRGRPTVEATIALDSGTVGRAGAPSGESTGTHEVPAFPVDGGAAGALGVFRQRVAPALVGREASDQAGIDATLHEVDRTHNFSAIGGNTATAVSVAVASATARERNVPLWKLLARPGVDRPAFPAIVGNCLNGGRHAINGPDIQEFHAIATAPDPADSIRAALRVHALVGAELRRRLPKQALGRGDEGGWVAAIGNVEAIEILAAACSAARDELHVAVHPGLDLAASEFFADGRYRYRDQTLDTDGQVGFVAGLVDRFHLTYLEDPLDQESFDGFAALTRKVGRSALVVGDDLYTTRCDRIQRGIDLGASNAVLIKVNQIGTLTDAFAAVDLARRRGLATVTSHRSGEVPDDWLAHVALASGAWGIKTGLLGGERVAKLNELLRLGRATGP